MANSLLAMSKFISSLNRCSVDGMAGFCNRKVPMPDFQQFLISFSFEKLLSRVATLTAIVGKINSIITIFGTEFPRLYFWINCKSSRGPSFSIVICTSTTSYNCDATITFFLIVHWNYQFFSAINCAQPPAQLTGLLGTWMQRGDLNNFHNDSSTYWSKKSFP